MSFIYLASPYSKYKAGIEEANRQASFYAGEFIKLKLPVFSPIAHSHSIAVNGDLSAMDHTVWMPLDFAFTEAAFAMVVCMMPGWDESYGIGKEIEYFQMNNKPIFYWEPPNIPHDLILQLDAEFICHNSKNKKNWPSLKDAPTKPVIQRTP